MLEKSRFAILIHMFEDLNDSYEGAIGDDEPHAQWNAGFQEQLV